MRSKKKHSKKNHKTGRTRRTSIVKNKRNYLVNTSSSDLDRIVYKNGKIIPLVPKKWLNNISGGDDTNESVDGPENPDPPDILPPPPSSNDKPTMKKKFKDTMSNLWERFNNLWERFNKKSDKQQNDPDVHGKLERAFAEVGKKLDKIQLEFDFDQQPGLSKPAVKKQTWVEATYDKSNVLNDVLREVLTTGTGYTNANIADIIGDYFREVEEDLALIRASASKKKTKKSKVPKKIMAIENKILKEQKFEIQKGLLEILYDLIPTTDKEFKHALIFLNEDKQNKTDFLENPGSPSKFHQVPIKYVAAVPGGKKKKANKVQKGGKIQITTTKGPVIIESIAEEQKILSIDTCVVTEGQYVDKIMYDFTQIGGMPKNAFSLLFLDLMIFENDQDLKKNINLMESNLKENGIIVADPEFTFDKRVLQATFKLKGVDGQYGVFVKDVKHFNMFIGLDPVLPKYKSTDIPVIDQSAEEKRKAEENKKAEELRKKTEEAERLRKEAEDAKRLRKEAEDAERLRKEAEDAERLTTKKEAANLATNLVNNAIKTTTNPMTPLTTTRTNTTTYNSSTVPLTNKDILATNAVGYYDVTTNGFTFGGLKYANGESVLVPWIIFKFAQDNHKKDDLKTVIKPLILRNKIEKNIVLLKILDEIINEKHCQYFEVDGGKKGECYSTRYLKEIDALLNLNKFDANNEYKTKIDENNQKSSLYQIYNNLSSKETDNISSISSDDTKSTNTTNSSRTAPLILEALEALGNKINKKPIYETYQDIRSYFDTFIDEIHPSTVTDSARLNTTRSTMSSLTSSTISSDDTTIPEYFQERDNTIAFGNTIKKMSEIIKKLQSELDKIRKQNDNTIDILEKNLNENFKPSPKDKHNTIVIIPKNHIDEKNKVVSKEVETAKANLKQKYRYIRISPKDETRITELFKEVKTEAEKIKNTVLLDGPPENVKNYSLLTIQNVKKLQDISSQSSTLSEPTTDLQVYSSPSSDNSNSKTQKNDTAVSSRPVSASSYITSTSVITIDDQVSIILGDIQETIRNLTGYEAPETPMQFFYKRSNAPSNSSNSKTSKLNLNNSPTKQNQTQRNRNPK